MFEQFSEVKAISVGMVFELGMYESTTKKRIKEKRIRNYYERKEMNTHCSKMCLNCAVIVFNVIFPIFRLILNDHFRFGF